MADKNWQAGGKILIPAQAVVCVVATVAPFGAASAVSSNFAPPSYVGSADPSMIWQMLIGGIVVCAFLSAIGLWVLSALRKVKRAQLRRNAFVSSALNNLSHGVVMTDAQKRIVFCNNRYLEIYGLGRSDIPKRHDRAGTAGAAPPARRARYQRRGILPARRQPGRLRHRTARRAIGSGQIFRPAERRFGRHPRGLHRAAPAFAAAWPRPSSSWNRCSTMCRYAWPPRTSRTAATSSPTARSSASRAFPATTSSASAPTRFSAPRPTASIEAADQAALSSPDGQFRNEFDGRARLAEARSRPAPAWSRATTRTGRNS